VRVLVVEDDAVIADHITACLGTLGYRPERVASGEDALAAIERQRFSGMVLDRLLPGMSGIEVLARLRAERRLPPVVMLSALGTVKDRIEGLAAGADDYLAKPFDMDELVARLNAVTRRAAPTPPSDTGLAVGRLKLDPSSHSVLFLDRTIELNRKQFSLLAHLMRCADRLVTRGMLLESVWGYAFTPTTNIVESNMSRLRARLEELGCDPIDTLRGSGYVLRSERCR